MRKMLWGLLALAFASYAFPAAAANPTPATKCGTLTVGHMLVAGSGCGGKDVTDSGVDFTSSHPLPNAYFSGQTNFPVGTLVTPTLQLGGATGPAIYPDSSGNYNISVNGVRAFWMDKANLAIWIPNYTLGIGCQSVNPFPMFRVCGVNTGTSPTIGDYTDILGTWISPATLTQTGLAVTPDFQPSGPAATIIGINAQPNMASGSVSPSYGLQGVAAAIGEDSGYTGVIPRVELFTAYNSTNMHGTNPVTNWINYNSSAIVNGDSYTGSTPIFNYNWWNYGATAAAGLGATISNYSIYVNVPSGSGAGTTNNCGICIAGNGGSGGTGTTTNKAFDDESTAPFIVKGGVQVGSPTGGVPAAGAINAQALYINNVPVLTTGGAALGAGTTNDLAVYTSSSVAAGLATANNGLLATNGSGVPSITNVIPNNVTATTQSAGDDSNKIATTLYVDNLASGKLGVGNGSGIRTAVTPSGDASMTNAGVFSILAENGHTFPTTGTAGDVATVGANGMYGDSATPLSSLAPLASPALTGNPTAPTQTTSDNSTKVATDAFAYNLFATPPPLGSTTPNTGAFSALTSGGNPVSVEAADKQFFTSSGTWTKPSNVTFVKVIGCGPGGGGGGGALTASGTAASGGAGGGGGGCFEATYSATTLTSTVTVTIGAGGTGGVAATSSSTGGSAGGQGSATTFGGYIGGGAGGGGAGGQIAAASGGGGGAGTNQNGISGSGSTAGGPSYGGAGGGSGAAGGGAAMAGAGGGGGGSTAVGVGEAGGDGYTGAGGGGSGGGLTTGPASNNGGAGADAIINQAAFGNFFPNAGGNSSVKNGASTATIVGSLAGYGGGGGYGNSSGAGVGGNGGAGTQGGGGGGGGSELNGATAGTGGAGGGGFVQVLSW